VLISWPLFAWPFSLGDSQLANQSTTTTAQSPLARNMAGSDPCTMVESRIVQKAAQLRSCPQANVVTPWPPEVPKASTCATPEGRANAAYHRVGENKYAPLLGPPQLPGHATPTRRALHVTSIPEGSPRGLDPELGSPTPKASKPSARAEPPAPLPVRGYPEWRNPGTTSEALNVFALPEIGTAWIKSASTQRSNPGVRIAPLFLGQGSDLSPE
jgi:hypothetical protein